MKNILFTAGLASVLVCSSCSDSFITNTPSTELPGENYTERTIDASMVGSYQSLQWFDLWMPLPFIAEVMADDVRVGGGGLSDQTETHELSRYNAKATTHSDAIWSACYEGIFRANVVINNAPTVNMDPAKIERLVAEAYALRTFYYYQVWRFYGNIPYFENNPTDIVNEWKTIKQYKAADVYEKLIQDIDKALIGDKLPVRTIPSEYGRFSRAAAQMLKAHIVLTQGDNAKYAEVVADMKKIIGATDSYDLETDFAHIWENLGEWGKESIFEINYTDAGAVRGWGNNNRKPGGSVFPTLAGISGFNDKNNDKGFASGWGFMPMEKHLYQLYDNADQRKNTGILSIDYYIATVNPSAELDTTKWDYTGYFNKKYLPRKGENALALDANDLNYRNNHRIFRLADTYLIAAELLLRSGGDAGLAKTYLNKVRGRAYNYTGTYELPATLDNILAERRLEFSGEGHRYFDLLRFGKAEQISKKMQTGWEIKNGKQYRVYGTFAYTSQKRYFPIPQSEVDRSLGALTQNDY